MKSLLEISELDKIKAMIKNRDFKRAKSRLTELVDAGSDTPEVFFQLANVFHIEGQLGKAIKAFQKVIELDPNNTDAAVSLSVLYNDIGRYEDAKKLFNDADDKVRGTGSYNDPHIDKKFSIKHLELAEMYMSYGRHDEALFEYNKARNLNMADLGIRVKVAKVYAKKGLTAKAIEELQGVKSEYPNFTAARMALGLIHYTNGNIIEARNEWQKILSFDPSNAEAKMYLNLSESATETRI